MAAPAPETSSGPAPPVQRPAASSSTSSTGPAWLNLVTPALFIRSVIKGPYERAARVSLGLLIIIVAALAAGLQPVRDDPLAVITPWTTRDWWLHPVERNPYQRTIAIKGQLNDIHAVPNSREVWAVGDGGLVIHTTNAGDTWTQRNDIQELLTAAANQRQQRQEPRRQQQQQQQQQQQLPDTNRQESAPPESSPAPKKAADATPPSDSVSPASAPHAARLLPAAFTRDEEQAESKKGEPDEPPIRFNPDQVPTFDPGTVPNAANTFSGNDPQQPTKGFETNPPNPSPDLGTQTPDANQPQPASSPAGPPLPALNDIFFIPSDPRFGWIVGSDATILATTDAGKTWTLQPFTYPLVEFLEVEFEAVAFSSATRGCIAASGGPAPRAESLGGPALRAGSSGGIVLETTNAGQSWSRVADYPNDHFAIGSMVDGDTPLIIRLIRDRGMPIFADVIPDRQQKWSGELSESTGFAPPAAARVSEWPNGTTVRHNAAWSPLNYLVHITSARRWILLGNDIATWRRNAQTSSVRWPSVSMPRALSSSDEHCAWAIGAYGTIARSLDAGQSWHTIATPMDDPVFGELGREAGALTFANGRLLVTTDYGKTWACRSPPSIDAATAKDISAALNITVEDALALVPDRIGIAGNNNLAAAIFPGTPIFLCVDNGQTWLRDDAATVKYADPSNSRQPHLPLRSPTAPYSAADMERVKAGELSLPLPYRRLPAPWVYLAALAGLAILALGLVSAPRVRVRTRGIADAASSDAAIRSAAEDKLGTAELAQGISRFIRNPSTSLPLTIAITGAWGTGKSSIMNMVRQDLIAAEQYTPVWFNAWHHQDEHLLAALLQNVQDQCEPPLFSAAGLRFKSQLLWDRLKRTAPRPGTMLLLLIVAFSLGYWFMDPAAHQRELAQLFDALSTFAHTLLSKGAQGASESFSGVTNLFAPASAIVSVLGVLKLFFVFWGKLIAFGINPAELMATEAGASDLKQLQQQTGFRLKFARKFEEVAKALRPRRLVIFIDDLDRCRHENVIAVLEAVNFLMVSGDCAVIMGMDRGWVEACVGKAFQPIADELALIRTERRSAEREAWLAAATALRTAKEEAAAQGSVPPAPPSESAERTWFARSYLEKLINVEVRVPRPEARQLSNLLPGEKPAPEPAKPQSRWAGMKTHAKAVGKWLERTLERWSIALVLTLVIALGTFLGVVADHWSSPTPGAVETSSSDPALKPGAVTTADKGDGKGNEKQPDLTPERDRVARGEIVSTPISILPTWPFWTFGGIAGLALLLFVLSDRPREAVQDSDLFLTELNEWKDMLSHDGAPRTPRSVRRYLNRVRFHAMRFAREGKDPLIPEDVIVALGAEDHLSAARDDDLRGDIRARLDQVRAKYRDEWDTYYARFAEVSRGIRTD